MFKNVYLSAKANKTPVELQHANDAIMNWATPTWQVLTKTGEMQHHVLRHGNLPTVISGPYTQGWCLRGVISQVLGAIRFRYLQVLDNLRACYAGITWQTWCVKRFELRT